MSANASLVSQQLDSEVDLGHLFLSNYELFVFPFEMYLVIM